MLRKMYLRQRKEKASHHNHFDGKSELPADSVTKDPETTILSLADGAEIQEADGVPKIAEVDDTSGPVEMSGEHALAELDGGWYGAEVAGSGPRD
jgi:hypothetical protein